MCYNQSQKNSSGKPTYGIISDRLIGKELEFRDPKGKLVVRYANVMDKLNITRDMALEAAKKLGWVINEEQFEIIKSRRGRPKKETSVSDTESMVSTDTIPEKKSRGRPKKQKDVEELDVGNNLIASLIKDANINNKLNESSEKELDNKEKQNNNNNSSDESESDDSDNKNNKEKKNNSSEESESDSDDEVEITVKKFEHKGQIYYKSEDNTLYNSDSELVGVWNEKKKCIDMYNESSSGDDDDE
jgi:hypothetical protein